MHTPTQSFNLFPLTSLFICFQSQVLLSMQVSCLSCSFSHFVFREPALQIYTIILPCFDEK